MNESYASINKKFWNKEVKEGGDFTQPWLNLDLKILEKFAKGKIKPLNDIYPISVLYNLKGKNVLCLASGGGQQSAIFSLLGANVTVLDISKGQLEGDKKAASHYGYKIKTVQGDMSNLSMLKENSFDLVYQAPSMTYTSSVKKVYLEVARVLKTKGLYRADAHNPLCVFDPIWKGNGYCITVPYAIKQKQRSKNSKVIEHRHYLDETFNGLVESGFVIERVEEMPRDLYQDGKDKPGSWEHSLKYVAGIFTILARKK
jgi:ubiquinone/menaquinone biosynthesis C-methylase UbiE